MSLNAGVRLVTSLLPGANTPKLKTEGLFSQHFFIYS